MTKFEKKIYDKFSEDGWTIYHDGWPDFLCVRKREDGSLEIMAIETKGRKDDFRGNQKKVLFALSSVMPVREIREEIGYGTDEEDFQTLVVDEERAKYSEGWDA
jgi:hypothetical protein